MGINGLVVSRQAPQIELSERTRAILERLSRSRTVPKRLAERVAFVLWSSEGTTCVGQARQMSVDAQRPRRWRNRWALACKELGEVELGGTDEELEEVVCRILEDRVFVPTVSVSRVLAIDVSSAGFIRHLIEASLLHQNGTTPIRLLRCDLDRSA